MRILLFNSHLQGGVEYFRMMHPNHYIAANHPDWHFTTVNSLNAEEYNGIPNEEFIKSFDLVHCCRGIDVWGSTINADRLRAYGVPFGLDLDDYWILPSHHILFNDYLLHKKSEAIVQAIKDAAFVTCTTDILAREIREYNSNVHVIPNAINHEEDRWQPDYKKTDKLRFGFFQGSTHFHDIAGNLDKGDGCASDCVRVFQDKKLVDRFQIVLAGFLAHPPIDGVDQPSIYIGYEKIITNGLRVLVDDPEYQRHLVSLDRDSAHKYLDKKYHRIWATAIDEWPYSYHFADVSLVPLKHNVFNSCKSELKLIEAGMKGKACIVQDVNPYKDLATEDNSFLVKGMNTFYKQMKRCIDNPNEVWDKAQQLREDVLAKYSLKVTTPNRMEVFKHYAKK